MRRVYWAMVAFVLTVFAVEGLAELTQNRPDHPAPGSAHELTINIATRRGHPTRADMQTLWSVCNRSSRSTHLRGIVSMGEGDFRLRLEPALGEHARRRVFGCLQDVTLDGMIGRVRSLERIEAVTAPQSP